MDKKTDKRLDTVAIADKEYNIRCTIGVLANLQEKFGTLDEFENKMRPKTPVLDEEGMQKKDEAGNPLWEYGTPDLGAITYALPLMVNEGILVEADRLGQPAQELDADYILRNVQESPWLIGNKIISEFYRAFVSKK